MASGSSIQWRWEIRLSLPAEGPFGDVHAVPSTVVLDSENRLVWKHVGLAKEDELERALR